MRPVAPLRRHRNGPAWRRPALPERWGRSKGAQQMSYPNPRRTHYPLATRTANLPNYKQRPGRVTFVQVTGPVTCRTI